MPNCAEQYFCTKSSPKWFSETSIGGVFAELRWKVKPTIIFKKNSHQYFLTRLPRVLSHGNCYVDMPDNIGTMSLEFVHRYVGIGMYV